MGNTSTTTIVTDWCSDNFDHPNLGFIGGSFIFNDGGERGPLRSVDNIALDGFDVRPEVEGRAPRLGPDRRRANPGREPAVRRPVHGSGSGLQGRGGATAHAAHVRLARERPRPLALSGQADARDRQATNPAKIKFTEELPAFDVKHYKTTHITGGATMGVDLGSSVCNTYGQVWDTPNVFVTGAALFPQNSAYNPTGTVAALAYRTGDTMAKRYFRHPRKLLD